MREVPHRDEALPGRRHEKAEKLQLERGMGWSGENGHLGRTSRLSRRNDTLECLSRNAPSSDISLGTVLLQ